jgi:hypothetical protein
MNAIKIKSATIPGKSPFSSLGAQNPWEVTRRVIASYQTALGGEDAANQAFKIFNAPPEDLDPNEREILGDFRGPSLSVGDIVEVHPPTDSKEKAMAFLCESMGWDSKEINPDSTLSKTPETEMPKVEFLGEECTVDISLYQSPKAPAISLWCAEGPMGRATINIPEVELDHAGTQILVKNYGENAPTGHDTMAKALEKAGVGIPVSRLEVGPHGAEVILMKVTHPAILKKIKEALSLCPKAPRKKPSAGPEEPSL